MSKRATPDFIQVLVRDLSRPSETRGFARGFWTGWAVWMAIFSGLTYWSTIEVPELSYLPANLLDAGFIFEAMLWAVVTFATSYVAYQSAFPRGASDRARSGTKTLLALTLIWTLLRTGGTPLLQQIRAETELARGRCGGFIAVVGMAFTGWLLYRIRNAAPTRLVSAGAWSAAAAGSAGCFFMHLVCRNENSAHLLIWHFVPLVALGLSGACVAKRALSW